MTLFKSDFIAFGQRPFAKITLTHCQGSFCPQPRQRNKEQRWKFLIPVAPKRPKRTAGVAWPTRRGLGESSASARITLPTFAMQIFMLAVPITGPLHCFCLCSAFCLLSACLPPSRLGSNVPSSKRPDLSFSLSCPSGSFLQSCWDTLEFLIC